MPAHGGGRSSFPHWKGPQILDAYVAMAFN